MYIRMSWLNIRNNSLRASFGLGGSRDNRNLSRSNEECDPTACYDSFKEHWQQALKIIERNQQLPNHDDVLGIVNHLEQMVTLLLLDVSKIDHMTLPITSPCLEYLLSENILDKIYEWGKKTGRYSDAVRLEQLKLYEMLVCQSRHLLLVHEPFLRPMLKLLMSCQGELFSHDLKKRLVVLLNQLCVLLMQNMDLLDLFFSQENGTYKFIIFSLLIPFMRQEGSIGMQARDALLLCMSLSKKNKNVGIYIAEHSNICELLASGLSAFYSLLPHVLTDIEFPDWHRLTPDDVNDIHDLSAFMTSLEFANAVAQVAHPMIRRQLQEFLYRGFLIPVLGPALLQTSVGERVAATAYLELILRTVTHPGLLYAVLRFLLQVQYDGVRLLDMLIQRMHAEPKLSLVSLALFETLVDLNCEDLMLELVLQHLQPCLHLMLSQRKSFTHLDYSCQNVERLLLLAPECCADTSANQPPPTNHWSDSSQQQQQHTLYGNYHAYLCDARTKITTCQSACASWSHQYNSSDDDGSSEQTSASLDVSTSTTAAGGDGAAGVGLFLQAIFHRLQNMLSNNLYVNLHLTGIISRLATYPHPLLHSYLLDHSLVLQPNVPSLVQIIGSLKQKIDEIMNKQADKHALIKQARWFLLERESRLANARRIAVDGTLHSSLDSTSSSFHSIASSNNNNNNNHHRNPSPAVKRKSGSIFSFTGMFGRKANSQQQQQQSNDPSDATSIPLVNPSDDAEQIFSYSTFSWNGQLTEVQHVARCAVLLEEWVKELAALAQEHTIARLTALL